MITGITFSCFDLLHTGHIQMLREAKSHCDYLIVGLQVDPSIERPIKLKPIQSLSERFVQLNAVKFVDEIVPYQFEFEISNILKLYMPDIRIIGEDHRNNKFSGIEICEELGIEIIYNNRKHEFSSTELKKRIVSRG